VVFSSLANFFFPHKCPLCDVLAIHERGFCQSCRTKINPITGPRCPQCGVSYLDVSITAHPCVSCLKETPHFDWHRSLYAFDEISKNLVHGLKYSARFETIPFFVEEWVKHHGKLLNGADYLIPVPLHLRRLASRSFNQSVELAKILSVKTKINFLCASLVKARKTLPQTQLKRSERLSNVKGSFQWEDIKYNLKDKKVILVDDVFTTGSTLSECARVLKKEGAKEVGCLTVAQTLLER